MVKRMIIMLVLCALVLGGVFGFKAFGMKMMMQYMAAAGNPPQTVSTTIAAKSDWQPELKAVGTIKAVKGADLSAEAQGLVENIFIESGQDVTEGTVLLQLRSADEVARLQSLEAQARLATLTVERDEKQLKVQAISQATYDADKAALESLQAQIAEQKATLQKKTLIAPFSGKLGIRKVDVGQYVGPETTIVTLQQLDAVYLDFFVPQQNLDQIQVGQKIQLQTDSYKGKTFDGEITAINPKVDEATRNVEVRATFVNPDKLLRPGMFATAVLSTGTKESHITLPQTAITFNPYGSTVYIVQKEGTDEQGKPKLIAKTSFVKTGATRGDQIAILDGIKEGDEIVTAGQHKLRNGSTIVINNVVQPSNDVNPLPQDK